MTSLAKVPCTIVTGFLGAGKTTLVRHVLENAGGRRLAVIVNEFGDIGIDGEILKSCGIESCPEERIVELSNGCICCTVADDFVPALRRLLDHPAPPEHIVIETSGLALPKPLVQAFNWPEIASRVTVDGLREIVEPFGDARQGRRRRRSADRLRLAHQLTEFRRQRISPRLSLELAKTVLEAGRLIQHRADANPCYLYLPC